MFEGVRLVRVAWDAYIVSFESEDKHKKFTNACVGSFAWGGTTSLTNRVLATRRICKTESYSFLTSNNEYSVRIDAIGVMERC